MTPAGPFQSEGFIHLAGTARVARGDLRFSFSRSSGPGGQAVNKLSTRAELRVAINDILGMDEQAKERLRALAGRRLNAAGEIVLHADTQRSQLDNKKHAIDRLRALAAQALVRPKKRRKSKPTRSMIEKRLESKRVQSSKKRLRGGRRVQDHD